MGDYTDYEFWCFLTVISIVGLFVLFLFLGGGSEAVGQFFRWISNHF
jgi:hypothetical protein